MKYEPDKALFPFDNRFFTASVGSTLHSVDEGRCQPILFLHGHPTNVVAAVQNWGGPIGLKLAQTCPDRIDRLVLGNTWAWPLQGDPRFQPRRACRPIP